MRVQDIRQAKRAEPFRAFTLHLDDGREFQVDHPEFILVSRNERTVIVDDIDGNIEIIDPLLVTSLSVAGARRGASGD